MEPNALIISPGSNRSRLPIKKEEAASQEVCKHMNEYKLRTWDVVSSTRVGR